AEYSPKSRPRDPRAGTLSAPGAGRRKARASPRSAPAPQGRTRVAGRARVPRRASPRRRGPFASTRLNVVSSVRSVFGEELAQPPARLEKPGLHRLLVDVQDSRDLLITALGKVAQHDDGPIHRRHRQQRTLNVTRPLGIAGLRLGIVASPRKLDLVVERLFMTIAPKQIERFVDRDPVDPAEELVRTVEFIETLGHPEKHGLRNVAGVVGTPDDPERSVVDRPLVPDHQRGERLPVTVPEALDQRLIDVVVHNYTRAIEKLARGLRGAVDLEELIEARVGEDVEQMRLEAGEPQLAVGAEKALLGLEQDAQAGARDVVESRAVERHRALHPIEE